MSSRGGSSLGTLLFSVPLAAIPLMAIFGIPQFGSLVASPERSDGYERARETDDRLRGDRSSGRRRATDAWDDGDFDQDADREAIVGGERGRRGDAGRGYGDRYGRADNSRNRGDALGDAPAGAADDADAPPFGRAEDQRPALTPEAGGSRGPAIAGKGLTWKSAAERFHELGITSYHLESGSEVGSFLFVCSFCPEATPNVTMRFESEKAEPLDAVEDVLAQIDRWQQRPTGPTH